MNSPKYILTTCSLLLLLVACVANRNAFGGSQPLDISYNDPYRKIDKVYREDGSLFSETNLFSDKDNGYYKTFHKNGQVATEIQYKDGEQVYDKAFDETGAPLFRNGQFKTFYAGGQTASVGEYNNDMKNGTETFYFYDGQTAVDIWHYLKGRRVDWHIRNDAAGNFVSKEDWGYPTYYVESLKLIIYAQIGIILLGAFALLRAKPGTETGA